MTHGLRSTYQQGCRCLPCRAANAAYHGTALVPAHTARAYLVELEARGLGVRRVATLSGVSATHVQRIRSGRIAQVRAETEACILAVKSLPAYGALVPSWPARRLIQNLEREGFSRNALKARFQIPRQTPVGRKVRLRTALTARAACVAMECGIEEGAEA